MSQSVSAVPESSKWPIVGAIGLFLIAIGIVNWIHQNSIGPWLFLLGACVMAFMLFGWFYDVVQENMTTLRHDRQTRISYRWGMFWFIFAELMFFGVFFGALFYIRMFSVPWLAGEGSGRITHLLLWPNFQNLWPVFAPPNPGLFSGPKTVFDPWQLPALNTIILICADAAMTWAYWAVLKSSRWQLIVGQVLAIILSICFLLLQVHEYGVAYTQKGLMFNSGIYGSTFFMLTGVHATHVIVGIVIVLALLYRSIRGHFDKDHAFAIAATSWYYHFIDVLWIALFIFVYWI